MKKYRVKEYTYYDEHKEYIIQYKWLFFWCNYKEYSIVWFDEPKTVFYNSLEAAKRKIQALIAEELKDKIKSSKTVYSYG